MGEWVLVKSQIFYDMIKIVTDKVEFCTCGYANWYIFQSAQVHIKVQ